MPGTHCIVVFYAEAVADAEELPLEVVQFEFGHVDSVFFLLGGPVQPELPRQVPQNRGTFGDFRLSVDVIR